FTGAQIIPGDFNGDHKTDLLVFRGSDGAFFKMYSNDSSTPSADFLYEPLRYLGGASNVISHAQIISGDWNGDGYTDVVVFRATDGAFWKWYGDVDMSPDFVYQAGRFIGGSPGIGAGAQIIPGDFNGDGRKDVVVFRQADGAFWKWYGDASISPD